MRFTKDPLLLFTALLCMGAAACLLVVLNFSASSTPPSRVVEAPLTSAANSTAAASVSQLQTLGQAGVAATSDRSAFSRWLTLVGETAATGANDRTAEGAGTSDPLLQTLNAVTATASEGTAHAGDDVSNSAARTRILMLVDRANFIIQGIPVPKQIPGQAELPTQNSPAGVGDYETPTQPTATKFPTAPQPTLTGGTK